MLLQAITIKFRLLSIEFTSERLNGSEHDAAPARMFSAKREQVRLGNVQA